MSDLPVSETPKAYDAFILYRDLGRDRSLQTVAEDMRQKAMVEYNYPLQNPSGTSPKRKKPPEVLTILSQLKTWSRAHNWQARVRAWDDEQREKKRQEREEEISKVNHAHVILARSQIARAVTVIQDLITKGRFTSQAAVQLLKVSIDLERVAMGIPTEVSSRLESPSPVVQEDPEHADLDRRIREDPDASRMAALLWERLSIQQTDGSSPGGLESFLSWREKHLEETRSSPIRSDGESGTVDDGSSSLGPQLPPDGTGAAEDSTSDSDDASQTRQERTGQ